VKVPHMSDVREKMRTWRQLLAEWIRANWRSFTKFALIGGFVFLAGAGLLYVLVTKWHVNSLVAYFAQAVFSVELSFVLNYHWTWAERKPADRAERRKYFLRSLGRWNVQKIITVAANQAIYTWMIGIHVQYMLANVITTAVFSVLNYLWAEYWSLRGHTLIAEEEEAPPPITQPEVRLLQFPSVSVVVPVKNSGDTIRKLVDALLEQVYPGIVEIVIVGDPHDRTWEAIADLMHMSDLRCYEVQTTFRGRDANVKRRIGVLEANGDVIVLTDSDMEPGPDWLRTGIYSIMQGDFVVAGGMHSAEESFWARYTDENALGGKTPRVPRTYIVTVKNFGARGFKPPIMANLFFRRGVATRVPIRPDIPRWDDYEWAYRIVSDGYIIVYRHDLSAGHYHRSGILALFKEYRNSGTGCADFIRLHQRSVMARRRVTQIVQVTLAPLVAVAATVVKPTYTPIAFAGLFLLLSFYEAGKARRLEAVLYPLITLVLGFAFYLGAVGRLLGGRAGTPADYGRPEVRMEWIQVHEPSPSPYLKPRGPGRHRGHRSHRRSRRDEPPDS